MTATITLTAVSPDYSVDIAGGPGTAGDWVGLFLVAAETSEYLDWRYLNNSKIQPPEPLTEGTVTFPVQTGDGPYDIRFFEAFNPVPLATVAIPAGAAEVVDNGYINVEAYRQDGDPDDTGMWQRAADAVRLAESGPWTKRGLYAPPGKVYTISDYIDLDGIANIEVNSYIVENFTPETGPAIRCRVPSDSGPCDWYFFGIESNTVLYNVRKQPAIQFCGMSSGRIEILACNYVEVFADDHFTEYRKVGFNRFYLSGVLRLELRDSGTFWGPWMNNNTFYGGRMAQLRIGGRWNDVTAIEDNAGAIRLTVPGHGQDMGADDNNQMLELYRVWNNGANHGTAFYRYTVVDADTLDLTDSTFSGSYDASEFRMMGRGRYPHGCNVFHCPDIEDGGDTPAIVHIQGKWNHLEKIRAEAANGQIGFGTGADANTIEIANTSSGNIPGPTDSGPFTVHDFGRENAVGWVRRPGPWGNT